MCIIILSSVCFIAETAYTNLNEIYEWPMWLRLIIKGCVLLLYYYYSVQLRYRLHDYD